MTLKFSGYPGSLIQVLRSLTRGPLGLEGKLSQADGNAK